MLLKKKELNPLDKKVIDNLRGLAIDTINEAGSGHPGIALGAAPILYALYGYHMKFDVNNSKWINRDRLVLSSGHGSALLYSTLHMAGFDITLDDLKSFRKMGSKTPGHPEIDTCGVDMSTGPLGQGIANGVGIAISERYLRKMFPSIINYKTYVLCGDGDLMEGISYEACSLAGTLKLSNLILLYDSNNNTLDGKLSNTFKEDIKKRFESMNWNYILVSDSEDIISINEAIKNANSSDAPTIIEVKTVIGRYSEKQGTSEVHGGVLTEIDTKNIKEELGLRNIPFQESEEATDYFKNMIKSRCENEISKWMINVTNLKEDEKKKLDLLLMSSNPVKLKNLYYELPESIESARLTSHKIINSISENYPFLLVGSADVSKSTKVFIDDNLRNIIFGVREHAMGAIANGIASTGLTPIISTFLSFSDYLKPSIRMSAMMNLPVIYVFTHDSISVGEDGPTHQPIEQLVTLRSIPNLDVYRPADANEIFGSYKSILETRKPSVIVLSRNDFGVLSNTKVNEVKNGAYIVKEEHKEVNALIISSGEDLHLAINVGKKLQEKGIDTRVVSMPSIERFVSCSSEYQNSILTNDKTNTFVIEMSSSYSWDRFVVDRQHLFTIDTFGESASVSDLYEKYNFTEKYIEEKIEELIK